MGTATTSFAGQQPGNFTQGTKEYTDPSKSPGMPGTEQDDEEAKKAAKARSVCARACVCVCVCVRVRLNE